MTESCQARSKNLSPKDFAFGKLNMETLLMGRHNTAPIQIYHYKGKEQAESIELADLQMIDQHILMAPQASFERSKHHNTRVYFIHYSGVHGPHSLVDAPIHVHSLGYS
jgi:hypothetical protein